MVKTKEFSIATFEGRLDYLIYLLQNFKNLSTKQREEILVLMVDVKAEIILSPTMVKNVSQ
jgi:hypothetical protein